MSELHSLTYKDREDFKKKLRTTAAENSKSDDELILPLSQLLQSYQPENFDDQIFQQHTLDLINILRTTENQDARNIARSALSFFSSVYHPTEKVPWSLSANQRAYVAGLSIKEISKYSEQITADEISGLRQDEKAKAEELFIELALNSNLDDLSLISYAKDFVATFEHKRRTRLVHRYLRNILFLVKVLEDSESSDESRSWASGALKYIRLNEDVIPDEYGLIGLLDDMYIASMAIHLIEPELPPWTELIAEFNKTWPFLNDLVFTAGETEYTCTDIAYINSALACLPLRGESKFKTTLVLPYVGITPNLIAIISVFGEMTALANKAKEAPDFEIGGKVLVDNTAIAIYDGIDEYEEDKYIRLNQIKKAGKYQPETISTQRIPLAEVSRLCLADGDAHTRGEIPTHLGYTKRELSAIESLLHVPYPIQFNNLDTRVWLIAPVNKMRQLASDLSIHGQSLLEIFPMGHIKRDGEYEPWNPRFGESENILTVVSDLDLAAEILEENVNIDKDLIIVNLSGANRNRFSALERIFEMESNLLFIAEERDEELLSIIDRNHPDIWEWSLSDIEAFSDSSVYSQENSAHPFYANDNKLITGISLNPSVEIISVEALDQCHRLITTVDRQLSKEADDLTNDFQDIYGKLVSWYLKLTKMIFPVSNELTEADVALSSSIERQLTESLFLSDEEKISLLEVHEGILNASKFVNNENPKWVKIEQILKTEPQIKIVVPSKNELSDDIQSMANFLLLNEVYLNDGIALLVPYWPGKNQVSKLLAEASYKKVTFLLYSYEANWFRNFMRRRESSRIKRSRQRSEKTIFNKFGAWPDTIAPGLLVEKYGEPSKEPDLVEINNSYRKTRLLNSIFSAGEEDLVKCHLLGFNGGGHAFLTPNYEAKLVTHLFEGHSDDLDEGVSINHSSLDAISVGDVLLFLKGSDKDTIREVADQSLPKGHRELAKLWQTALIDYVKSEQVSLTKLVSRLSSEGCKKHMATVQNWLENDNIIGPRDAHRGDIEAISAVTNNSQLAEKIAECKSAITEVWGQHIKAANMLAQSVLDKIENDPSFGVDIEEQIEVFDGVVMVSVEFVDSDLVLVPRSKTNQLIEDE